jgi:hypothetical protein
MTILEIFLLVGKQKPFAGYIVNKCGVVLDPYRVYIAKKKHTFIRPYNEFELEVKAAEVFPGVWCSAINISGHTGGYGEPLSYQRRDKIYSSFREAILAGIIRGMNELSDSDKKESVFIDYLWKEYIEIRERSKEILTARLKSLDYGNPEYRRVFRIPLDYKI